jgi:carboxymethylenebutenolidase
MIRETYTSAGDSYNITVYPAPLDGKKHPVIVFMHGNFGLGVPYGNQIHGFARDLASRGYMTAVPQYYQDSNPHLSDIVPHIQTLTDAVKSLAGHAEADSDRLGLVGFSLGAVTAMTFIAANPPGTVKVFADFFGFLTPTIRSGIAKFPPTIIFHNKNDRIVPLQNSADLDRLLPAAINHQFVPAYDELWEELNHAFKPSGPADVDSQSKTTDWIIKHLPPGGR